MARTGRQEPLQERGFRKFGDKHFTLKGSFRTKAEALKAANRARAGGLFLVRVTTIVGGYGLWLKDVGSAEPTKAQIKQIRRAIR